MKKLLSSRLKAIQEIVRVLITLQEMVVVVVNVVHRIKQAGIRQFVTLKM